MMPLECESEYICVMVLGVIQTRGEQTQPAQPRSWSKSRRRKRQSFDSGGRNSSMSLFTLHSPSLRFDSRLRQNTLLFRSYLRRRPTEWGVGRSFYRFSYAKSCYNRHSVGDIGCVTVINAYISPIVEVVTAGSAPPPKADPPKCAYLLWSTTCYTSTDRRSGDSTRIHPKNR